MNMRLVIGAVVLALMAPVPPHAQTAKKPAAPGGPQPSVEIPLMTYDFGEVFERDKYEYKFTVRNRGDADLMIEDVKPG